MVQVPVIGFIGRLDYQKGADLVLGAAPWLLNQDVQIICLGTGDKHLEVTTLLTCWPASHHAKSFCQSALSPGEFGLYNAWCCTVAADSSSLF